MKHEGFCDYVSNNHFCYSCIQYHFLYEYLQRLGLKEKPFCVDVGGLRLSQEVTSSTDSMAIEPGTYNFTIQRRADWSTLFEFKDSSNAAVNLTGYTAVAQAWNANRTKKHADFTVAYTDRSNGKLTLSLTDDQTTVLPDSLNWDLALINASSLREYWVEGVITVSQGYSA